GEAVDCQTVKTCRHQLQPVTLSQVKQSYAGQVHHVRVQLRSYEPHRLHQALKLFCSRCTSIQNYGNTGPKQLLTSDSQSNGQNYREMPPFPLGKGDFDSELLSQQLIGVRAGNN
ncbi:hypothetical protein AMECASPLE_036958, partial [Ameca splendens]